MQTKLGKALCKLLGKTSDVIQCDKYRYQLKTKGPDKYAKERYSDQIAILHTHVSKTLHVTNEKFNAWEKEHFL